jgi:glycosyltransferase involved in cell wall biosynthesis
VASLRNITFAAAVSNRGLFEDNFLASPCLRGPGDYQILAQQGHASASIAYNDAIDKSLNNLIVFCHQDVYLPEAWLSQLQTALDFLEARDPAWGVLGCSGLTRDGQLRGYLYSAGLGVLGTACDVPTPVRTLDEVVLIIKKSSGLRFDDTLPHFHLYGTDICLRAAKRGMKSYAISVFCIHNTQRGLILPEEFYECCKHIKRVWKDSLPIQNNCIRITRFNVPIYLRRMREFYLRYVRGKELGVTRVQNVQRLFQELGGKPDGPDFGNATQNGTKAGQ